MLRDILHHPLLPYAIIIDIGSGSVGVAIIEIDSTQKKPLILYTHQERIRVTTRKTEEERIRTLKEALLAATLELSSNGMRALAEHDPRAHVESIHVLYAAPWSEVVSRIIKVEKEEPMKATDALIATLVEEALKQADTASNEVTIFAKTGLEVINKEIISGKLNGYSVTHFTGQSCISIEITHLSELAPKSVRDALRESEKNLLPHPQVTERTFTSANALVAQRLFPHTGDFITIEVTGEATECAVIRDGILYENFYTLFGAHSFERALAVRLGTIENEVRAHIRDYSIGASHEEVTTAVQETREIYKNECTLLLNRVKSKYVLPANIVVTIDPQYREFYRTLVEEIYSAVRSDYKIHTIDTEALASCVEYAEYTEEDQYIAIIALFFHMRLQNSAQEHTE